MWYTSGMPVHVCMIPGDQHAGAAVWPGGGGAREARAAPGQLPDTQTSAPRHRQDQGRGRHATLCCVVISDHIVTIRNNDKHVYFIDVFDLDLNITLTFYNVWGEGLQIFKAFSLEKLIECMPFSPQICFLLYIFVSKYGIFHIIFPKNEGLRALFPISLKKPCLI